MVKPSRRIRLGATTVETAFALPILFLFFFSGVEFARVNMIRNAIQNAAYEGAREGMVPGATNSDCAAAANRLIDVLSLQDATISVTPSPILPSTDAVAVSVTVPINTANSFVMPRFYLGKSLNATVRLSREDGF